MLVNSRYGPTFGGGHDLHIADNSNLNFDSYSALGYSFSFPLNYTFASTDARSFLAGSMYFQTVEVEVYTSNTFDKLIYSS